MYCAKLNEYMSWLSKLHYDY